MTGDAQTLALRPEDDLYDAVQMMAVAGVRSVPVLEHERVVGILSRADVLRALVRADGDLR
jgi:CBS domain-containing protein